MDYKVELDTFRGPLDLLLFLVKRNEVDLGDIPIARILAQFLVYLQAIQVIDVEGAGEFLVMAATLMEIKSKLLLPRSADESAEEDDPRLELVKQLIEYKKYKEAAGLLEEQARRQMARLARMPAETTTPDPAQQPLRKVELWDLVSAFGRLMRETAALQPPPIVMDDTPIFVHMERIQALLRERGGRLSFREVFVPPLVRGRLLGLFLAVLELTKGCLVLAEQSEAFGEIWLELPGPAIRSMMGQDSSVDGPDGRGGPEDASR